MADLGSARLCTSSACFTGAPLRHFEYTSANHLKFEQQTGRLLCFRRPRRSLLTAHAHKSSVNAVGEPATRPLRDNDQSVNVGTDARASEAAASSAAGQPVFVAPEDYQLLPGQMSSINRTLPLDQNDVFRCAGCTEPACQGPSGCAGMSWRLEAGGYLREVLTAKVYDVAVESPLQTAEKLSEEFGNTILLKREDLQPVKSFKLRGAYNKMAQLTPEQLEKGVICSSAGNHAQGVAMAAKQLGCQAVICMPINAPAIKVNAVRALGGIVDLAGETYFETQAHAQARSAVEGKPFIAPYDDPYTIAGQGTIGAEILRQCNMDKLDAVFVPIGGGGLVAGVAAYIKAIKPRIKVIGVEPTGANAMTQSLHRGQRVTLSKVDAFADGVAVKYVGAETFRLCRELVDGVVLVDNASISRAIKDVFNETRSILEPSGAVAVAGAKAYLKHHGIKGSTVVAITSGANMNFDRLRLVTELADVGVEEAMLAVTIPEVPGSFVEFVDTALNATNIQVTEFKYRYSSQSSAHVLFGIEAPPGSSQCQGVIDRLNAKGMATMDISELELAQVHLRHLVGGHPLGGSEEVSSEHIYEVDFPERPGALRKFLSVLSPRWNITLFHYIKTGNQASGVLLGIQIPSGEMEEFGWAVGKLGGEYTFTEIEGKALQVAKMFIQ